MLARLLAATVSYDLCDQMELREIVFKCPRCNDRMVYSWGLRITCSPICPRCRSPFLNLQKREGQRFDRQALKASLDDLGEPNATGPRGTTPPISPRDPAG